MQYGYQTVSEQGIISIVFPVSEESAAHDNASIEVASGRARKAYVTRHFAGFWHQVHIYEQDLDYPFGHRPYVQGNCPICGQERK